MWIYNNEFQCIFPLKDWKTSYNLAIFDLDQTLIFYPSGKNIIPKDENDWDFLPNVINVLWDLLSNNYQIVIITNQKNISREKENMILDIWRKLDNYPLILCSTKDGIYRKPNIGLMAYLYSILNEKPKSLFYCGDAVGSDDLFLPYRWSSSDKDFATNIGSAFYKPSDIFESNFETVIPNGQLIIMMGNIASGKTTVAKRLDYIRFSQDEIEKKITTKKSISYINSLLLEGKKVIIDQCHSSNKSRQIWIDLGYSTTILWCIRDGRVFNKLREKPIPQIAYSIYSKNFEYPNYSNVEVIKVY